APAIGGSGSLWGSGVTVFPSPADCEVDDVPTAVCEPCGWSDPGLSRIPDWKRRCMGFYFSSSWSDSPLTTGSWLFRCWPRSQDWNSLSLLQTSFKASVTTYDGEQSRNSAYFVSFSLVSPSSRSCTTVVLGCFGGAFRTAIGIISSQYLKLFRLRNRADYISACTRAKHGHRSSVTGRERPHRTLGG